MLCPFYPFLVFFRLCFEVSFFFTDLFDVNITFGNRSTRRIDPRTPEGLDP